MTELSRRRCGFESRRSRPGSSRFPDVEGPERPPGAAENPTRGSLLAGYMADLVRVASHMPDPARGAAVAARIAAHAHAGGDEGKPGYEEAYAEERARQAEWLRTRLEL
jgi:hypothetical protein